MNYAKITPVCSDSGEGNICKILEVEAYDQSNIVDSLSSFLLCTQYPMTDDVPCLDECPANLYTIISYFRAEKTYFTH